MKKYFIFFWLILILVLLFDFFNIINFGLNIFSFIVVPIGSLFAIIKYLKTSKVKLDVRLNSVWVGMALLVLVYGDIYHQLSKDGAFFLKCLFLIVFGILTIYIFNEGRQYKNKNKLLVKNYKPLYRLNKDKDLIRGWITAYYWTAIASLIMCLLILRVK